MKAAASLSVGIALLLTPMGHLGAQIPANLSYQAYLSDETGNPISDGTYSITFSLYDVETEGTVLWTETKALEVKQGLFYTYLGDQTAFPGTLRFDRAYWLGIQVDDEPELVPRIPLSSVGYSFTALRADSSQHALKADTATVALSAADLADDAITSEKIQDGTIATADLADNSVTQEKLAAGLSLPPGGIAGGDLTGEYPNPTVADNAITSAKILDGTLQSSDVDLSFKAPMADTSDYAHAAGGNAGGDLMGEYPNPTLAAGAVSMGNIDTTGALAGEAIMFNGTEVVWQAPPNPGGTITEVIAGAGLDGGGSIGSVTLDAAFAGSGIIDSVARSDHSHDSTYWSLTGNSGTASGTNYLGTSDDNALELKVNNARALRLEPNTVSPNVIGGYSGNNVAAEVYGATIGGGGSEESSPHQVNANYGTIGGGDGNIVDEVAATVGGGDHNTASESYSVVAGGYYNESSGTQSTVGGGANNIANATGSTVSGGVSNSALSSNSTVSGGNSNEASNGNATVGGGTNNTASGSISSISGGSSNTASGGIATVGGGLSNTASGVFSTVPGGWDNVAGGGFSFAAGWRAKANHGGTFVWADSTNEDFASTDVNQFLIRASGGVGIGTDSPGYPLHVMEEATPTANPVDVMAVEVTPNGDLVDGFGPALILKDTGGGTVSDMARIAGVYEGYYSALTFHTNNGSGLAEKVRIDHSGNVGIGTDEPAAELDVNGTIAATGLNVSGSSSITNDLTVNGTATATDLDITNDATISGSLYANTLDVTGAATAASLETSGDASIDGTVVLGGGEVVDVDSIATTTTNYYTTSSDRLILCNPGSSDLNIFLHSASSAPGQLLSIRNKNPMGDYIAGIFAVDGVTLEGMGDVVLGLPHPEPDGEPLLSVTLYSDGITWWVTSTSSFFDVYGSMEIMEAPPPPQP